MINKTYPLPVTNKVQQYQAWLAVVNFMLGKNHLTETEIEILSYLLCYNDRYSSIKDDEARNELLFSTSVKRKIRDEFNIETSKFETYLNKLRKKGIIKDNIIDPRLVVVIDNNLEIKFNISLIVSQENTFVVPPTQTVEQVTSTSTEEIIEYQKEELPEVVSTSTSTGVYYPREPRPIEFVDYNL